MRSYVYGSVRLVFDTFLFSTALPFGFRQSNLFSELLVESKWKALNPAVNRRPLAPSTLSASDDGGRPITSRGDGRADAGEAPVLLCFADVFEVKESTRSAPYRRCAPLLHSQSLRFDTTHDHLQPRGCAVHMISPHARLCHVRRRSIESSSKCYAERRC